MYIYPDNELLQYSGRIDFDDSKAPVFVYVSSSVKAVFTGESVKVVLKNRHSCWGNWFGYVIDGSQGSIRLDTENEVPMTYVLAQGLGEGTHELILFKRQDSEDYVTFLGLELDEGAGLMQAGERPKRRIEVYGDSVSCGEVSEAVEYVGKPDPVHNGQYSNSWYSYAWIAARRLGAELHNISQGGIALLDGTGYFGAPELLGMESCFDKLEYLPDMGAVKPWDFSRYTPHVVVVAIGQNDSHPENYMAEDYHGAKAENWRCHYGQFIRSLIKIYPSAHIILTTTILFHDEAWDRAIDEVCRSIDSGRVHHYLYGRNGSGTPGHIRIPEAEEMAEELVSYIETLGDDIWRDIC